MAEDCNETEYHEAEIVKIQAVFRGVLVRKWMKQTREEYGDVFRETERNGQIYPTWKSNKPCRPTIQRKDKKKKSLREVSSPILDRAEGSCQETRTDNNEVRQESLVQTEFLNGAGTIPIDVGRKDEVEIKSQRFQSLEDKFLTVETQTSFCEPSASIQEKHITEQCVQTENQTTQQLTLTTEPILTSHETETSMTHEETKVLTKEVSTVPITKTDVSENETKNTAVKECLTPIQGTKLASKGISYIRKTPNTSSKISPSRENPAPTPQGSHGCFSNETSVWDSFHNVTAAPVNDPPGESEYPKDYESLQDMRKNIAMELLWVQQAINSRKNYLKLKGQMAA